MPQQKTVPELIELLLSCAYPSGEFDELPTICRELADRGGDALPAVPALRELQESPFASVEVRCAALRAVWRITGKDDDALAGLIAEFQQALAADPLEKYLELTEPAEVLKEMGEVSRDTRTHLTNCLLQKYEEVFDCQSSRCVGNWEAHALIRPFLILDRYTLPDIRKLFHASEAIFWGFCELRDVIKGRVPIPTNDILNFILRSNDDNTHALLLEELGTRNDWEPVDALPAFKQALRMEIDCYNPFTCFNLVGSHPNTCIDDLLDLADCTTLAYEEDDWGLMRHILKRASDLSDGELVTLLSTRQSPGSRYVIQSIIDDREKPIAGDALASTP